MGILNEVCEYRNTGLWLLSNFDNFDNLILFPSPFHISKLATGGRAVATSRLGAGIGKTRPAPTKHRQTKMTRREQRTGRTGPRAMKH